MKVVLLGSFKVSIKYVYIRKRREIDVGASIFVKVSRTLMVILQSFIVSERC